MESHKALVEDIKAIIRKHRSNGHFAEGAEFIAALPKDIICLKSVAIEAAQLYLVQGHSRLAAQICNNVPGLEFTIHESDDLHPSLWKEEDAAFELMRAYIWITRFSKLKTALKFAWRLGNVWKLGDDGDQKVVQGKCHGANSDRVTITRGQDQALAVEDGEKTVDTMTEYLVLMKFYYWKIFAVAAEQGLIDEKIMKTKALEHISSLRQIVQSAGRFREARFLIYFECGFVPNPEQKFKDFLQLLNNAEWDTEKAFTLADLGEHLLKSKDEKSIEEAHQRLEEAEILFKKISHGFGCINLDLIRVSSASNISAGEKFVRKTEIANRYFRAGHYQNGLRCLAFSISPEMAIDMYYEQVANALELLEHNIKDTGSELLKQVSLIHAVCQASLKAPEYGFALQSLESYYANVPEEIGPKFHSLLASTLSFVYSTFGEHQKAIQAARESLDIAKTSALYDLQSDAAFAVGIHLYGSSELHPWNSTEASQLQASATEYLKIWADKDAENRYIDGEVQKCLQIAGWENIRAVNNPDMADPPPEQPWINRVKKHLPDSEDALKRSQLVDTETRMLMRQKEYHESLMMANNYLDDLNTLPFVHPLKKGQAFFRVAAQAHLYGSSIINSGQALTQENMRIAIKYLWSAVSSAHDALQQYREANGTEAVIDCTVFVWQLLSGMIATTEEAKGRELLRLFMSELHQTEQVCDQMRRSVVPISRLKSLMTKRLLVAKKASLRLYNVGVSLALRLNEPKEAWLWLQKGKARAFADSLGASLFISKELLENISTDPVARQLLEEEQNNLDLLSEPGANYVIAARQLASVRARMAQISVFTEISRIRDGMFNLDIDTNSLLTAISQTGLTPEQVKFIDWSFPSSTIQIDSHISIFVRTLDGSITVKKLSVSASQVKEWITKAYVYPDKADPPLSKKTGNRFLQTMNNLLEGLAELTKENDLLILSPSGPMSGIPLHALSVEDKPLIMRNLVVYSASTATLGECLNRMSSESGSSQIEKNTKDTTRFFAVYEEPSQAIEREHIFRHIKSLSVMFSGGVSLGPDVTKSRYLDQCSKAKWTHYHGHARYGRDDILKSSLVLSDGFDLFAEPINDDIEDVDWHRDELSVSELFSLKFPDGGVHTTIIACDSGTQDVAPGDEPLGIIPAMLHAGATSVLGCQWPIDSRAGRAFSEEFYKELISSSSKVEDGGNRIIHLADALRKAVAKMKSGELDARFKQPYYWAAFALHGLWFLPSPS